MTEVDVHCATPAASEKDAPVASSSSTVHADSLLFSRVEGPGAAYVYFAFPDLERLAYSVDLGWIGGTAADVELLSQKSMLVVIAVVAPGVCVGYGVVLGAPQLRSGLKEVTKRDVPRDWEYVIRVGWMRVASVGAHDLGHFIAQEGVFAPPISSRSGPTQAVRELCVVPGDTEDVRDRKRSRIDVASNAMHALFGGTGKESASSPSSGWLSVDRETGVFLCQAVDEMSLTALPHDLRVAHNDPATMHATAAARSRAAERGEQQQVGGSSLRVQPLAQQALPPPPGPAQQTYPLEHYVRWMASYYPHLSPAEHMTYAQRYYQLQFQGATQAGSQQHAPSAVALHSPTGAQQRW